MTLTRPDGSTVNVRGVILKKGNDWRATGLLKPTPNGQARVVEVRLPSGFESMTDDALESQIKDVLTHEFTHGLDPAAARVGGVVGDGYANSTPEVNARIGELARELRTPEAQAKIFWDDEFPDFTTKPEEWAASSSRVWNEYGQAMNPENRKRFLKAIASAFDDAKKARVVD